MTNPVHAAISRWTELPEFLEAYNRQFIENGDGIGRVFGYGSIITEHRNEKPEHSHDIPNERAKVPGAKVSANVLAMGENEYRGTHHMEHGVNNVGVYLNMEVSNDAHDEAKGMNVTVAPEDMPASMAAYITREIGDFPGDISLEEALTRDPETGRLGLTDEAISILQSLEPEQVHDDMSQEQRDHITAENAQKEQQNVFGLYKLEIIATETKDGRTVPAMSVATNEDSPFTRMDMSPEQIAHHILDGHGISRQVGQDTPGGTSFDYFAGFIRACYEYGEVDEQGNTVPINLEEGTVLHEAIKCVVNQVNMARVMEKAEADQWHDPRAEETAIAVGDPDAGETKTMPNALKGLENDIAIAIAPMSKDVSSPLYHGNVADRTEGINETTLHQLEEMPSSAKEKQAWIAKLAEHPDFAMMEEIAYPSQNYEGLESTVELPQAAAATPSPPPTPAVASGQDASLKR